MKFYNRGSRLPHEILLYTVAALYPFFTMNEVENNPRYHMSKLVNPAK